MSHPKVYEFAKEIGVETLVLMDKIRKWELPVKSHMAELNPDVLEQIREKLGEESKKKTKKKKAATKKAATKKAAAKKTAKKATAKKAVKKVAKKVTTKKATAKDEAVAEAPSRKTVIRRKKAEAVVEPQVEAAPPIVEDVPVIAEAPPAVEVSVVAEAPPVMEVPAVAKAPVADVPPEVKAPKIEEPAAAVDAAPAVAAEAVKPAMATEPVVAAEPEVAPEPAVAPEPVVAAPVARKTPVGKREVKMTESGPVSGVKSERPRRNIIGKMDLSRVKPQQQNTREQSRPQKTSTRNLRPGFVSQPADTFVPEPESAFSSNRKDRDKKKRVGTGGPPAGSQTKDKEAAPPAFVSSEFKKREIVFQPKKKRVVVSGKFKKTEITMPAAHKRVVKVFGAMSVSDLAQAMGAKVPALMKVLIKSGIPGNMNTVLDFDTISLIVPEFKFEAENVQISDADLVSDAAFGELDAERITRMPVVTVMGHVDHGKTTLLDYIRKARVADGEAGGITQHVGAYRVQTTHGKVTFIDTPGHEAFTAMRARGANSTDIVILVVAAEDGVMPQTIEAVNHAKAAGVPIVVAMNKMDKPDANPDKIKQQLAEHELVPEDWGGTTIFCPVSALKGDGVAELLDQVSLTAEILELKGNPDRSATGLVVESRVEKGRGNIATLLVQDGTLKSGQSLVIGEISARARQIYDETGKVLKSAGPSCPVEVIGLPECPAAGDRFDVCKDERTAQSIAGVRRDDRLREEAAQAKPGPISLEELFSKVQTGELKELPVVLKTDVAGTGEAIQGMFKKLATEEVQLKIIHQAVGGISESDVLLAKTAGGIIVGFNTRPDTSARKAAREKNIEIKTYSIVYELMDEMKKVMSGLLDPDIVEKSLGRVEVRETFTVPKMGTIAGSFVTEGKIVRNALLRLVRDGKVVYSGKLSSLRRFKDDVKEVATGFECGIGIENFNDIKVGDEIEAYIKEEVSREL